jgi:anaerobic selenocysteine-containing dehydrogenase
MLVMDDEALVRAALDSDSPLLDGITYEVLQEQGWARLAVPTDARPHVDPVPGVPNGPMRLAPLTHRPGVETVGGGSPMEARYPLALISRKQHPKFLNANYGGFPDHYPSAGEPTLQLHPKDAADRGIDDSDRVRVFNDRGELTLRAEISEDLQPGLVATAFGWWNSSTPQGRAVNALTNATLPDDDHGSAYFHDTLVQVEVV